MKQEIVIPFPTSAKAVWGEGLDEELTCIGCYPVNSELTTEDITFLTRVKGSIDGRVLYGFDTETARSIAPMKSAAPFDGVDDTATSIVEWFVSNISGRAAFELDNGGYRCRISRPLAFTSVGSATNTGRIPRPRVIFTGDPGNF